ncbi:MAG: cyclase family protein [Methanomicrobiales archaeon]|nr:cyclase family protein [Methanomicrobiales archaeon]
MTRLLSENTAVYPGDMKPSIQRKDTGLYVMSELCITSHAGTHIDAPAHYLHGGLTIDRIPLTSLVGRCRVIEVGKNRKDIEPSDFLDRTDGVKKILFRTSASSQASFGEDFPHLTTAAASAIAERGCDCVGIDSPSIEAFGGGGGVHRQLLDRGVVIIELLDLSNVRSGDYLMVALPLKIEGGDGAPARVILMER